VYLLVVTGGNNGIVGLADHFGVSVTCRWLKHRNALASHRLCVDHRRALALLRRIFACDTGALLCIGVHYLPHGFFDALALQKIWC